MYQKRKFLAPPALIILSFLGLVACSNFTGSTGSTDEGPLTATVTHTLENPEATAEAAQNEDPTTATKSQPPSTSLSPSTNPRDFADLTEVDAQQFWGRDSGSIPGFRFQSPTGNINCHLSEIPAACNVRDHAPWPEGERRPDGLPMDIPSSVVGWMGDMDLMGRPMNWLQQGTFPVIGAGNVLEYGQMITVLRKIDGVPTAIACGSRESGMTCMIENGQHGFAVSRENYQTW